MQKAWNDIGGWMMSCELAYTNVIEDINCVKEEGTKLVKKTWKERITWKFWEGYKEVPNHVPTAFFVKGENTIICHPSIKNAIEEDIERLI